MQSVLGGTNVMKINSIYAVILHLFIIFAISVSPVSAQSVLEEIIVTARKREQNIQDVSISITAFTARRIREMNLLSAMKFHG